MPTVVRQALEHAMQHALANVPQLTGRVVVAVDVSGSMSSSITGYRQGATSKLRCVDVAALFASALKHVNPQIEIMPFDTKVRHLGLFDRLKNALNSTEKNSVFNIAKQFANMCGGGTDCSQPLKMLNQTQSTVDLVIYFSDNESWAGQQHRYNDTGMMQQWKILKQRCPQAKMVCVDLQPYITTQMPEHDDVINIGGFSDDVFRLIALFAEGKIHPDHWINEIEKTELQASTEKPVKSI